MARWSRKKRRGVAVHMPSKKWLIVQKTNWSLFTDRC